MGATREKDAQLPGSNQALCCLISSAILSPPPAMRTHGSNHREVIRLVEKTGNESTVPFPWREYREVCALDDRTGGPPSSCVCAPGRRRLQRSSEGFWK